MKKTMYHGRLMSGECVCFSVEDNKIGTVESIPININLPYILPVLVDLQHNGALGVTYNMLEKIGIEKLHNTAKHLRRNGIGRCLATITTYPYERLQKTAELFNDALVCNKDLETLFFGIFHEGVFISPVEGWRGAHPAKYIKPPDWNAFNELDNNIGNRIKVVNIAPEEPGGLKFIEKAVENGKKVALGHCCPTPDIIRKAVARGASMVTHFGNGAVPNIHRFKNPFWELLNNDSLKLGLICDGCHLPPDLIGVAIKCKGLENCYPVSDASGYSGKPPGTYKRQFGDKFVIEEDGYMHMAESEILAGAWFQLNKGVEFLVKEIGLTFLDAWKQCSLVPAKIIGIDLPQIKAGEEASFVIATWENNALHIKQSVHNGISY
jgi:N-acetylglucosamine-6-phosphate deacetylase